MIDDEMLNREEIEKLWDRYSGMLRKGFTGSLPRDWFEGILDVFYEKIEELKNENEGLKNSLDISTGVNIEMAVTIDEIKVYLDNLKKSLIDEAVKEELELINNKIKNVLEK